MDKKNTMLLTVIAVATLLVAVVGATFAYFSVTGSGINTTAAINTSVEEVGMVNLTGNVTSMAIKTLAADFAQTAQGYYWAKDTTGMNAETQWYTKNTTGAKVYNNVYSLAVNGGSNDAAYVCTVGLTINTTPTLTSNDVTLNEGEYVLYLKDTNGISETPFDMSSSANQTLSKTLTIYVVPGTPVVIQAAASLRNTDQQQQTRLSGASIVTNFNIASYSCDTVASATTDSMA